MLLASVKIARGLWPVVRGGPPQCSSIIWGGKCEYGRRTHAECGGLARVGRNATIKGEDRDDYEIALGCGSSERACLLRGPLVGRGTGRGPDEAGERSH